MIMEKPRPNKDQAQGMGSAARQKNQERICPALCEGGDVEEAWYVGYDRLAYANDVKNKVEKKQQEFIFPGPSKDDPPMKRMI